MRRLSVGMLAVLLLVAPVACTIKSWDSVADAGTATVQTWKVATAKYIYFGLQCQP